MEQRENISEELFSTIESYLLNKMSIEEKTSFEQKMEADGVLKQKVEEYRLLIVGIMEEKLEEQLNEFHKELKSAKQPKIGYWLTIAAAIVIVMLLVWILPQSSKSNEKLFAAYYTADPGLITAMSETDQYQFDKAMVDYKTGQYHKAVQQWEKLTTQSPSDTLLYFIASAYLADGNTEKAIDYYQKVATYSNSAFKDEMHWYLGLALLKQNKIQESVLQIQQSGHPDKEKLLTSLHKHAQQ